MLIRCPIYCSKTWKKDLHSEYLYVWLNQCTNSRQSQRAERKVLCGMVAMFMEVDVADKKQPSMTEKCDLPLLGLLSSLDAGVRLRE